MAESRLAVELEGGGPTFTFEIKSYRIDSDYFTPTDGWSFVVHHEEAARLRRLFQPLAPVALYIDGRLQVRGRIDRTEGLGNGSGSALRVSGRDYLADLITADVDPTLRFEKGTSLESAILDIVRPFGITHVASSGFDGSRGLLTGKSNQTGEAPRDFTKVHADEFKPDHGVKVWELLERILSRHGATLQPTGSRATLALAEPSYGQEPLYSLIRSGGAATITSGRATRDFSDIPSFVSGMGWVENGDDKRVRTRSEVRPFELLAGSELKRIREADRPEVVARWVPKDGVSGEPLFYRPAFPRDDRSKGEGEVERAQRKRLSRALAATLSYSCTVRGHTDEATQTLYSVDSNAHVGDEIEDVNEPMWIQGRTFRNDGRDALTDLRLVRPGAYTL